MFTILYKFVVGWFMPPGCFIILFVLCAWKIRLITDPALRKTLRTLALAGSAGALQQNRTLLWEYLGAVFYRLK